MKPGISGRGAGGAECPSEATYKERLDADFGWACREGDAYFSERSAAHVALRRLTARLDEIGTPYAVIGAMAMYAHKFRRFTEDIDVIVARTSLATIHAELEGRGYRPPFAGSKNLIDTEQGVRIVLVIAGGFPGDGKEKPIAFPDPSTGTVEIDGVHYVTLEKLVELKLASGMTGSGRLKDLGDVESVIRALKLPRGFGARLHPWVQPKFDELWVGIDADPLKDEF